MKAKIRLYKNDGENESGFPIKIILSHERKTRRKTIAHSRVYDWNDQFNLPMSSHPDFEDLHDIVSEIYKRASRIEFSRISDFDTAFNYLQPPTEMQQMDFLDYGEMRAKYMEQKGRLGNARAYRIALNELRKYKSVIFFRDITHTFIERFKQYKLDEGLKNTSVRGYLYALQAIYKAAVKSGLTKDLQPFEGVYRDIKVMKRRARNAYFEKEEIEKLEQSEFTQKNYNLARDLALLQFYLCGLDFVDLCYLKHSQVYKGRAFIKRHKLGERAYEFDIKIPDKAQVLLDRHKGNGKTYFFDFPKSEAGYRTFRVKMYRCLQQIKKRLELETSPKDATFTLKTMRHTFATLGKFERIEEDLLRELMGHERNDIDTVYKDKYPEAERDAAQLRIIS